MNENGVYLHHDIAKEKVLLPEVLVSISIAYRIVKMHTVNLAPDMVLILDGNTIDVAHA